MRGGAFLAFAYGAEKWEGFLHTSGGHESTLPYEDQPFLEICWGGGWLLGIGIEDTKPAWSMPFCTSSFFMKAFQIKPERKFSAISSEMPTFMAITSSSYQSVAGLKESTKP